jgi:ribosome-associated translation inhibitor RaiA
MAIKISCGKGTENLSDYDKNLINGLSEEYEKRIERHFNDINLFEIRVRCFSKEGNVKRYEIDARVIVPGFNFEASADERILQAAVNNALDKIMNEIEHKVHLSNQGRDDRRLQNVRKRD